MDGRLSSCSADEEYIDMEVISSHSHFFSHYTTNSSASSGSSSPPPSSVEFKFQMFSTICERDTTTASPADELFYQGKLLPFYPPPPSQMVENLLHLNSNSHGNTANKFFSSFPISAAAATTSSTISPSESCQVSKELNPNDYFSDYAFTGCGGGGDEGISNSNKSWTSRRVQQIKMSSVGSRLRASSRACLKTLFIKSGCSGVATKPTIPKECIIRKSQFGQIQTRREMVHNHGGGHLRKRFSTTSKSFASMSPSASSSSSSSSSSSNGFQELPFRKRSSSSNSSFEADNSIQAAIVYCKRSFQQFHPSQEESG